MSSPLRLLFISDTATPPDVLTTVACHLQETVDCRVHSASMVRQGVEQASIQRFDLFVLDVQTPEVDGLHLCRILKTLQPGVPVVYYVNFSDFPHARDMLAECGNYFLARPVKAAELEQVIRVVLPNEPSSS